MQIFRTFKKMLNCGPVIKSFGSLSLSPVIGWWPDVQYGWEGSLVEVIGEITAQDCWCQSPLLVRRPLWVQRVENGQLGLRLPLASDGHVAQSHWGLVLGALPAVACAPSVWSSGQGSSKVFTRRTPREGLTACSWLQQKYRGFQIELNVYSFPIAILQCVVPHTATPHSVFPWSTSSNLCWRFVYQLTAVKIYIFGSVPPLH